MAKDSNPLNVPYDDIMAKWNAMAMQTASCPTIRCLTLARRRHLNARWQEATFRDHLDAALEKIKASQFMSNTWGIGFDRLISSEDTIIKIIEGTWDDRVADASHKLRRAIK